MTYLVFGKTGQVATELRLLAEKSGGEMIFLGRDQADLADPTTCAALIHDHRPNAVINAAAYTAVDKAETEEALAHLINAEAPGAMAAACTELDIPLLHVSTDYVFAGDGTKAWQPGDKVGPRNAYGRTKLAGEEAIRATGARHAILRTSWVFSAHGNNFVKTMLRLSESRDALSIVDDQIGGPTPAGAIAAALQVMADTMLGGHPGGIYHFAGQPAVSWRDFAEEIFHQAGRDVSVSGIATTDYPTPAQRPLNSRLDCASLRADFGIKPPDWKTALEAIVRKLAKQDKI